MTTSYSRRSFLRGQVSRPEPVRMRPPGAQPGFSAHCTHCGDCQAACPEGIIVRHASGEPEVELSRGACTFCQDCARACEAGALVVSDSPGWAWRAFVKDDCLSLNGIACRTCEDSCEPRALGFRLMTRGRSVPVIDLAQCTGCGECAFVCPAGAIEFAIPQPEDPA